MTFRRISRSIFYLFILFVIVLLLAPEWSASASNESKLQSIVGLREYDFLVWESNAFRNKGETILAGGQQYLNEQARKQVVLDYLDAGLPSPTDGRGNQPTL